MSSLSSRTKIYNDPRQEMDKDFIDLINNNDIDKLFILLTGDKNDYLYDKRYIEYAIKINALEVLELFKDLGDISAVLSDPYVINMALRQYTPEKTYKTVKFLLENGASTKGLFDDKIRLMIIRGYFDIVLLLIKFGVKVDYDMKGYLLDKMIENSDFWTIEEFYQIDDNRKYQFLAGYTVKKLIDSNNIEMIEFLLKNGITTLLKYVEDAIEKKSFDIAKILINYGATIDKDRRDILYELIKSNNSEIVELLLKNGQTELLGYIERSINNKSYDVAGILINYGAEVNKTLFEKCIMSENQFLIESLKNLNIDNKNLLLDNFVVGNQYEMVEAILKLGADPNTPAYNYVRFATQNGYMDILELLLSYGANPNGSNENDVPLFAAIRRKNTTAIDILLGADADVNITSPGNNALMIALIEKLDYSNVYKFYMRTSNFEQKNLEGKTALDLAFEFGDLDIIDLLLPTTSELIDNYPVANTIQKYLKEYNKFGINPIINLIYRAKNLEMINGQIINDILIYGDLNILFNVINHDSSILKNGNIFRIRRVSHEILMEYLKMILPFLDRRNIGIFRGFLIEMVVDHKPAIPDDIVYSYIDHYNNENYLSETLMYIMSFQMGRYDLNKYINVIKKLLEKGADINYITNGGQSPLALSYKIEGLTVFVLDYGADPNLLNHEGLPPLFYIHKFENRDNALHFTKILLDRGADPYFTDEYGKNPLVNYMFNADKDSFFPDIVDLLVDYTPDLDYTQTLKLCVRQMRYQKFKTPKNDGSIEYFTYKD